MHSLTTVKTERHPNGSMHFILPLPQKAPKCVWPIAKLYVAYPLVTRDSLLPQIIYACHYGIFKQESCAIARKPRDAAVVLLSLMFADDIHYKFKVAKLRKPGFRAPNIPAQNRI